MGIYVGNGWIVHSSRFGTTLTPMTGWYETTLRVGPEPASSRPASSTDAQAVEARRLGLNRSGGSRWLLARVVVFDGVTKGPHAGDEARDGGAGASRGSARHGDHRAPRRRRGQVARHRVLPSSEDDYATGDAALNAMPTADTPGRRTSVTKYDVVMRMVEIALRDQRRPAPRADRRRSPQAERAPRPRAVARRSAPAIRCRTGSPSPAHRARAGPARGSLRRARPWPRSWGGCRRSPARARRPGRPGQ